MIELSRVVLEPIIKKIFGEARNNKIWSSKEPFKKNGFLDSHLGYALPEYTIGSNLGLKDYKICLLHSNDEYDEVVLVSFLETQEDSYTLKKSKVLSISKYESYSE